MQNKALIGIVIGLLLLGGGYLLISNKDSDKEMSGLATSTVSDMMEGTDNKDNSMMGEEEMERATGNMEENEMAEGTASENANMAGDNSMMENDNMMEEDSNVKVFKVNGGNYYFSPNKFTVKKGDTVKVVLTNDGGTHDWVIDEFDARTKITQTGETAEVTFVADKTGDFQFYCSIGQHRANGMYGTLTVE